MNNFYEQLVRIAEPNVIDFINDYLIYDKKVCNKAKDSDVLLWGWRITGTDICNLSEYVREVKHYCQTETSEFFTKMGIELWIKNPIKFKHNEISLTALMSNRDMELYKITNDSIDKITLEKLNSIISNYEKIINVITSEYRGDEL